MRRIISAIGVIAVMLFACSVSASALQFDEVISVQSTAKVDVTQKVDDLDFKIDANTSTLGTKADISNSETVGGVHTVPEPSIMLLLGIGLLGIAGIGRSKFKNKAY